MERDKEALLEALHNTSGIISSACRAAGVSRMTYYRYYNEDPEFRERADDIKELQKDFAESLKFAVAAGSATAFSSWLANPELIGEIYRA